MTCHYFIATMRPIEKFHMNGQDDPFISGEAYKKELPLSLPYVYEYGGEDPEFISFLDDFMEFGDVVEFYIYEEGKRGRPLSINLPEEARTINLLKKTYKDENGEYQLDEKRMERTARQKDDCLEAEHYYIRKVLIASKRGSTTYVKC